MAAGPMHSPSPVVSPLPHRPYSAGVFLVSAARRRHHAPMNKVLLVAASLMTMCVSSCGPVGESEHLMDSRLAMPGGPLGLPGATSGW